MNQLRHPAFLIVMMGLSSLCNAAQSDDAYLLNTLFTHVKAAEPFAKELNALVDNDGAAKKSVLRSEIPKRPLHQAFPQLTQTLPVLEFGDLPTPIHKATQASKLLNTELMVKMDSDTGPLKADNTHGYGGNKVRKLEFLLADALEHNAKTVLTFGCVGSNHATATAACAHQVGLKCYTMLKPQPNSQVVRKNLRLMNSNGAELIFSPNNKIRELNTVAACIKNKLEYGDFPYVIPTGGSCPLGAVGFVNAALELKQQIKTGVMEEPDYIYLPAGSQGTAAGLILGAHVAGLKSKIMCICVEPEDKAEFEKNLLKLARETNELLHARDASFPLVDISPNSFSVVYDCCGQDYGVFSPEAVAAIKLLKETEKITLEGTYTGKALAGLIRDAQSGKLQGKKVLFWNTYCSDPFSKELEKHDHTKLPKLFHRYFEQPVQPLDQ